MKRAACLISLLAPILGWSQSEGKGVFVSDANPMENRWDANAATTSVLACGILQGLAVMETEAKPERHTRLG